jgi:hypothetical protein
LISLDSEYVAPTSARAERPFKSLLKPRLAHASARRIKPGLIFALLPRGKSPRAQRFQQKVLASPRFELGAFCFLPLRFPLSANLRRGKFWQPELLSLNFACARRSSQNHLFCA